MTSPNFVIVAKRKKHYLDPSSKVTILEEWLDTQSFDPITTQQIVGSYKILIKAGLVCPYIDLLDDSILITWNNDSITQRRILYLSVRPGKSFRYQMSKVPVINGDHDWRFITDKDTAATMLYELGCYMAPPKEVKVVA